MANGDYSRRPAEGRTPREAGSQARHSSANKDDFWPVPRPRPVSAAQARAAATAATRRPAGNQQSQPPRQPRTPQWTGPIPDTSMPGAHRPHRRLSAGAVFAVALVTAVAVGAPIVYHLRNQAIAAQSSGTIGASAVPDSPDPGVESPTPTASDASESPSPKPSKKAKATPSPTPSSRKPSPRKTTAPPQARRITGITLDFEAESGRNQLRGGASVQSSNIASGGAVVGNLGNGGNIDISATVTDSRLYLVQIFYVSQSNLSGVITVNGNQIGRTSFPVNSGGLIVRSLTLSVPLRAGNNVINLSNPTGTAPAIDKVAVLA